MHISFLLSYLSMRSKCVQMFVLSVESWIVRFVLHHPVQCSCYSGSSSHRRISHWQVIRSQIHHVLHSTKETGSSYGLRRRRHNRELLNKSSRLVQSCFLVRMLYKDIYWLFRLTSTNHLSFYIHIIVTLYNLRFVTVLLKFYWLIDWLIDWLLNFHFKYF